MKVRHHTGTLTLTATGLRITTDAPAPTTIDLADITSLTHTRLPGRSHLLHIHTATTTHAIELIHSRIRRRRLSRFLGALAAAVTAARSTGAPATLTDHDLTRAPKSTRAPGRARAQWRYRQPPNWPAPADPAWAPPPGWHPDPAWGPPPPGWQFWVPASSPHGSATASPRLPTGVDR